MNAINWKKMILPNIPYLLFVYLFDKVGQAVRLSPGTDLSGKVLSLADGFSAAFANLLPSLAPMDLLIGIVGAVLILILSRLVDTFISKISLTMLPVPKPHNTACVLSWEEARRWQSRSSGYSSS